MYDNAAGACHATSRLAGDQKCAGQVFVKNLLPFLTNVEERSIDSGVKGRD
jgi:hypothetical protein